jgi:hypothetical protein
MSLNRQLLKDSLILWYGKHPENLQVIHHLNLRYEYGSKIEEEPKLPPEFADEKLPSLRQIDYCVVNFGKRHKSCFYLERPDGSKMPFELYAEYKSALHSNSKELFDPFRRGEKFEIDGVKTTICQLNFFRWAIPNKVLDFAIRNLPALEREMAKKMQTRKRKRVTSESSPLSTTSSKRKVKEEINKAHPDRCAIHTITSVVKPKEFPENAIKPYEFYKKS